MALTETRVEASVGAPARRSSALALLGSGDHKVIGRAFIAASLVFLVAAAAATELLSVDRLHGSGKAHLFLTSNKVFTQLFTTNEMVGVFLGLVPLLLGIALVVVPLQVGSRTLAFPRAATGAFWTYLAGGALVIASIAINGGPAGTRTNGIQLWSASLIVVLAALLVATACVVTTAFALRAPGMTLDRVPLFTWGMVVGGVIWLLTFPVLIASLLVLYVDFTHGRALVGDVARGSIYFKTLWAVRQPEVYALVAPALGFAGDVLPVVGRARYDRKLLQYQGALLNIGLFAVLGFGAYTATFRGRPTHSPVYIVMSFMVVLPVLGILALAGDIFRRGRKAGKPQVAAALMFAVAGLLLILTGAIAGAVQSVPAAGVQRTLYDSGQAALVLIGGVAAALGGLHWWCTKILRRPVNDLAGAGAGFLLLAGGFVFGVADLVNGGFGKGAEATSQGITVWNYIGAAGGAVALLGLLLAIVNLLPGVRPATDHEDVPVDPWQGHTLEWITASPPAVHNFDDVPFVTSEAPLLDRREAGAEAAR